MSCHSAFKFEKKSEIISDILMTYCLKDKKPDATQVRSNHKSEPEGNFKRFFVFAHFLEHYNCV